MLGMATFSKRSRSVAEYFETLIRQQVYGPGDKLPTLDEMAELLKVSRSTIREGLAALVAQGLVEAHHGKGYFVSGSVPKGLTEGASQDLGQVLFVRCLVEVPAAKLAAQNRTEAHLEALAHALAVMRDAPRDATLDADLSFHLTIAEASGNRVLHAVMSSIAALVRDTMRYSRPIAGTDRTLYEKHWELFEAIERRDPRAAEQSMHSHLFDTAARLKVLIPEAWALSSFPEAQR
jgi:GntR family transcriptional repressor for pyruvate dehydrogenase complex